MAKNMSDLVKMLEGFQREMSSLDNTFAAAGWDNSTHPTADANGKKLSYASLAYLHEYGYLDGTDAQVPARKLFYTTLLQIELEKKPEILNIILTNFRKYGKIHKQSLLEDLSEFVKSELERIMGNPNYLLPNSPRKGRNTPLVDSGALKRKIITRVGEE